MEENKKAAQKKKIKKMIFSKKLPKQTEPAAFLK